MARWLGGWVGWADSWLGGVAIWTYASSPWNQHCPPHCRTNCTATPTVLPCPAQDDLEMEVDSWLRRKFEGALKEVEIVHREDLDLKNHLSGIQRKLLKLTFWNQEHLMQVGSSPACQLPACRPACLPAICLPAICLPACPPGVPCAAHCAAPACAARACCLQVRREIQPIVSRNRYRRDGTSAYQLLAEQQRPTNAKAGKERLQVGVGASGLWAGTLRGMLQAADCGPRHSWAAKYAGSTLDTLAAGLTSCAPALLHAPYSSCLVTGRAGEHCGDAGARCALPRALRDRHRHTLRPLVHRARKGGRLGLGGRLGWASYSRSGYGRGCTCSSGPQPAAISAHLRGSRRALICVSWRHPTCLACRAARWLWSAAQTCCSVPSRASAPLISVRGWGRAAAGGCQQCCLPALLGTLPGTL